MSVDVYIGFGSNLGDLDSNHATALRAISRLPKTTQAISSPLYISEPLTLNGEEQPWYLNAVFKIQTDLSPMDIFEALKNIERQMGRTNRKRWSSRIIDLDILFYDELIYCDDILQIPHPEVCNRNFVIKPLLDLDPHFIHPEFEVSLREIWNSCPQNLRLAKYQTSQTNQETLSC